MCVEICEPRPRRLGTVEIGVVWLARPRFECGPDLWGDWEGGEIGAVLSVRDESVSDFTMLPN